jgi:hypothetical protein
MRLYGVQFSELLGLLDLCAWSGILRTVTQSFGNWICFHPQGGGDTLLGPLERADFYHLMKIGPVWVMRSCRLLRRYQRFGGSFALIFLP